jgi:ActR/RegA family two-component response regulator
MVNTRRFAIKKRAIEYKGGKCSICGYDKCKQALEFHHRDDTEKEFNISGLHSIRWERIQRELDKCDLLCANCHREVHSTE